MPLPRSIMPMLAKSAQPFDSEDYEFELKWDGTRCIMFIESKGIRLQNRRLVDITYRYPEFRSLRLRVNSAIIDGELVVLEAGVPSFRLLQQREHIVDPIRIEMLSTRLPATYVAFDLLYLNGKSLLNEPLVVRRGLLKELMPITENVVFSEGYSHGKTLFSLALKKGFEGIMAKERQSPYLPGVRSAYWLKIKKMFDVDAVVCGYLEGEGLRNGLFGSLILGLYQKGRLRYIGRVGTGFNEQDLRNIHKLLRNLRQKEPVFEEDVHSPRTIYWVRPEVVVRVRYQELTHDGLLRVPVFKGLREDKAPAECTWEQFG